MACPFFLPLRRLDSSAWNPPPRFPLVDAWSGTCCAPHGAPFEPREDILRELCNMGYARGRCEHFPGDSHTDAVRFSLMEEDGSPARVLVILEKDHAPVNHGEFDADQATPPIAAQGRSFLESHARLREEEVTTQPQSLSPR